MPPVYEYRKLADGSVSEVAIGSTAEATPLVISRAQLKLALLAAGRLDDVDSFVANSGDRTLKISWADRVEFKRDDPLLVAAIAAFGLTEEAADDIFRSAGQL